MKFKKKYQLIATVLLCASICEARNQNRFVIEWGVTGGAGLPSLADPSVTANCVKISGHILNDAVAISEADYGLCIKSDGTVAGWGGDAEGRLLGSPTPGSNVTNGIVHSGSAILSNVVSVVATHDFSLALKKDGSVVTWGNNYVPAGITNIVAIAAEWGCSWALRSDGTVVGWSNERGRSPRLSSTEHLSNIVAIAVGPGGDGTRGVALCRNGTVVHWGNESTDKEMTPPVGLTNVVAVAAGDGHSLALKADGTVVGWGFNTFGQATGNYRTNDPEVVSGQVRVDGQLLRDVVAITANRGYSMALRRDGTIVTWGRLVSGLYPVSVPAGLSNIVAISAGYPYQAAITTNPAVAERFGHGP